MLAQKKPRLNTYHLIVKEQNDCQSHFYFRNLQKEYQLILAGMNREEFLFKLMGLIRENVESIG